MNKEISQLSSNPTCYFTKCSVSSFFPSKEKSASTKTNCPDVTQCIQVNEFDITGKINTNSINYGSETCVITSIDDCILSDWSQCINGKQTRTIVTPPTNGGKECGELSRYCSNTTSKTNYEKILIIDVYLN